ncbi:hypothetical protein CALCODRAFT_559073 [Calocera cornea HHB12733]|uniref:Uncharacterized protein n=1 Tax=Calocera cornea HHB12733 TaxID=1353952 RepID=A0A165CB48_9BASI|nr:hypothetical protein CALCODRAFT_559073 [Calocera cornea HHB12733]
MHGSSPPAPPASPRHTAPTASIAPTTHALPVPRHTMSTFRDLPGAAFRMDTQLEVTTVLANCGGNVGLASRAIRLWIESKQRKGRAEQDIITKVEGMERKYTFDASLHEAFHAARAETGLPRSKVLPPSRRVREAEERERQNSGGSPTTPTGPSMPSPTAAQFNTSAQPSSPQTFHPHTPSLTTGSSGPPSSVGSPSLRAQQPQGKREHEFRPYSALQQQQQQQQWGQPGPSRSPYAPYSPYAQHQPQHYPPPSPQAQGAAAAAAAGARYSPESHLPYLRSPSPAPTTSTRRWSQGSFETITDGGGTATSASASMLSFATSSAASSASGGDDESLYNGAPFLAAGFPMTRTLAQSPRLRGDPGPGPSPTLSAQGRGYPLARTVASGPGRVRGGWTLDHPQLESEAELSSASSGSGSAGTGESLRDWRAAVDLIEHFPSTPTPQSYSNVSPAETVRASTPRSQVSTAHPSPLSSASAGPPLARRPQDRTSALHVSRPDSPLISFSLPPAALDADAPSSLQAGKALVTPAALLNVHGHALANGNGMASPVSPNTHTHSFGPRPRPPSGQKQLPAPPLSPIVPLAGLASNGSGSGSGKSPSPVSPASRSSAGPTSPHPQLARQPSLTRSSPSPNPNSAPPKQSPLQNALLGPAHSHSPDPSSATAASTNTSSGSDWAQPSAGSGRPTPAQTANIGPGSGGVSPTHPGLGARAVAPRHQFSGDSVRTVGGSELPPPAYSPIDPRLMEALGI